MKPDSMKRHSSDIRLLRAKGLWEIMRRKKSLEVTKNKDYFNLNYEIREF